jgi:hypothetical protein
LHSITNALLLDPKDEGAIQLREILLYYR